MSAVSVPLQVVFIEHGPDELVIDCLVSERVVAGPGRSIAAGTPFTLTVSPSGVVGGADAAVALLERWSDLGGVVEASGSVADGMILLRAGDDEVLLSAP